MFSYNISTGEFKHDALHLGFGYSGFGVGKNNASMVNVHEVGPIPPGAWRIDEPHNSPHLGPCVFALEPQSGTETFGRSGFFIHGDSISHPGEASHGCVILSWQLRRIVEMSKDRVLTVTV